MKSKGFQNSARVLITAGSLFGFLGGWVLFAHSPHSAAQAAAATTTTTAVTSQTSSALRPSDLLNNSSAQIQPLQSTQTQSTVGLRLAPRLRTGGS